MAFGKKDKSKINDSAPTLIGVNCTLEGNLKGNDSICIEGRVFGEIESEQNVYVNKDAVVEGDIVAQNVVIHGKVIGNIKAKESTLIGNKGRVIGDVNTKVFSVESGGVLHGRCFMESQINEKEGDSKIKNLFDKFSSMSSSIKKDTSLNEKLYKAKNDFSLASNKSEDEEDIIEVPSPSEESKKL